MRFLVLLTALASLMATASAAPPPKPPKAIVANPTTIAVYVPPSLLSARSYLSSAKFWIEPGKALSDALHDVGTQYFPNLRLIPAERDERYGLLLDLAPKWSAVPGKATLTIQYDVYDAHGKKVRSGSVEQLSQVKGGDVNGALFHVSRMAVQQVMADVQAKVRPDPATFPDVGMTSRVDPALLVDRGRPVRIGTAFFVNTGGQLLTATHIVRGCVLMDAHMDGDTFPVTLRAASDLLDVAVLDSGKPRGSALPLRQGHEIALGEAVTSIGYQSDGRPGDAPHVARGNISASKGVRGALGMFQFSAPIWPGNTGGPIVSDHGELLGMAVGTLNPEVMAKLGFVPQNTNFALDARHVATFLRRENVPFSVVQPKGDGSLQMANTAALSQTVQISCYE